MNLKDLGLTMEELTKIYLLAKLFNCQKMTVQDIKDENDSPTIKR